MRILIVEDNEAAAWGLSVYLTKRGYTVATAAGGAEAAETAPSFVPDVMLVDIGLPDIDGCDLVKHLRTLPELAHTVFVAVTGHSDGETTMRITAAGFRKVLIKPVSPLTLMELFESGELT